MRAARCRRLDGINRLRVTATGLAAGTMTWVLPTT
jgi:hypothetical protein